MKRLIFYLLISFSTTTMAAAQLIPADDAPADSLEPTTVEGSQAPATETSPEETPPEIFESTPAPIESPAPETTAGTETPTIEGTSLPSSETDESTAPGEAAPPDDFRAEPPILRTGPQAPEDTDPVAALNVYLDGFHFKNGEMDHQMEAHHYCAKLNEHMTQCVIYDENNEHARLIGLEYVVSRQAFEMFSDEEKKLWHSHAYEVTSGQLVAPKLSDTEEGDLMDTLVDTYGKTWHTWDTVASPLPVGIPSLMMGFTEDGQTDPKLIEERDKRLEVSTDETKERRRNLPSPSIEEGADSWQKGDILQLKLEPQNEDQKKENKDKASKWKMGQQGEKHKNGK